MKDLLEDAKNELATKIFDQGVHFRILFVGRSVNGTTDIVSCLSRSLRNLGHHVLDIDLKKHRALTDNPNKVTGGHGPIFLRPTEFTSLCEKFQPQIVICCAGGLTFYPDHAAQLKERGIVLIGITLSDPDVFSSVHSHAHVFDFHTTNARHALAMYEAAGINNTVYFPFGIDRGFINQSVFPAPELSTDVICMGHATGRPERNELMGTLAKSFDVKTYGRGWGIEGSESVSGSRMVQAMRMGKIHINFPLTRAGYLNIKCGVFESIGSGALLCTGFFEEMADFFEYGREIIGYKDSKDLSIQLNEILASPERYRAMTGAAFRRLANEHLYEHRWMNLIARVFNCSPKTTPWLSDERINEVRRILTHSLPRAKHVLLSGFYGASNLGDELILRSIQQGLERADPSVQITVASENPSNVERDHGLQSFSRRNHQDSLHQARTASAIMLGGGGLWHDYTFLKSGGLLGLFQQPQISMSGFAVLPLLGRMFGVPCHVVGMGVGPMSDPDAYRMLGFVSHLAESIYVRDEESRTHLRHAGTPDSKIVTAPDVVYALPFSKTEIPLELNKLRSEGYRLIGVNLRPWAKFDENVLLRNIAEAIKTAVEGEKFALIPLPMQAGAKVDELTLMRFVAMFDASVPSIPIPGPPTLEHLAGTLACCDVLVSMRLHACLVAHRLRKPVVGIAYDPKVSSHFEQLDRAAYCLMIDASVDLYATAIRAALDENGCLPEATNKVLLSLESEALAALGVAASRIAALPASQKVFEVPKEIPPTPLPSPASIVASRPSTVASVQSKIEASLVDGLIHAENVPSPDANPQDNLITSNSARIWLPTTSPKVGQYVRYRGTLSIKGKGDCEVSIQIKTNYQRLNYSGRVLLHVCLGEYQVTEDLSNEKGSIQVKLIVPEHLRTIPIEVSVIVAKDSCQSSAWPRVSRVDLSITDCQPLRNAGEQLTVLVSRGEVRRISSQTFLADKQSAKNARPSPVSHQ